MSTLTSNLPNYSKLSPNKTAKSPLDVIHGKIVQLTTVNVSHYHTNIGDQTMHLQWRRRFHGVTAALWTLNPTNEFKSR